MKTFILLLLLIINFTFAWAGEVDYIPKRQYLQTVLKELDQAKESIKVYLYLLSVQANHTHSPGMQLIQALVRAQKRGVQVEVVLDQNLDFTDGFNASQATQQGRNMQAYRILAQQQVPVFFDGSATFTHSKVVVIDGKTVILGSTNWSMVSITQNNESNVLIRSTEVAQQALLDLKDVPKVQAAAEKPGIALPRALIYRPKGLGLMVKKQDERALDTYLYLLQQSSATGFSFVLSLDDLAKALNLTAFSREDYRRQFIKTLKKLQNKYGLLKVQFSFNQDPVIELLALENKEWDGFISIPLEYWDYGWSQFLSLSAKLAYILNLEYSSRSEYGPLWRENQKDLGASHHVHVETLQKALQELRQLNLLDVEYRNFESQNKTIYIPLPLYDPRELDARLNALELKYGSAAYQRATQWAALVKKQKDAAAVEELLRLEQQFGAARVEAAAQIISAKSMTNPKRTFAYFTAVIRRIHTDEE